MRILWIDDEVELLRSHIYYLKRHGYEVLTATNGPDGLELFKTRDFDLVLLDQWMSGLEGLDVLRRLKAQDPEALVALVTKAQDEAVMDEAYGELVDDFVVKPFTPSQLLAVVKRLLEKRSLVGARLSQRYAQEFWPHPLPNNPEGWVEYYRELTRWGMKLERFGDPGICELQAAKRDEATTAFSKYVERVYPEWLKGPGPILSHQFFPHFVIPRIGNLPCYLILLDSMRLDQWFMISGLLRDDFQLATEYYYSILPSATPYSRNAIFSGLLPLEIAQRYPQYWVEGPQGQNRYEEELLRLQLAQLWPSTRVVFVKASRSRDLNRLQEVMLKPAAELYVLVVNFLDLLIHSTRSSPLLYEVTNKEMALLELSRIWFAHSAIYELLKSLAQRSCQVIITSDHGFVKVNRPTLVYGGREISTNLRYKYGGGLRCDRKAAVMLENPADYWLPVPHPGTRFIIAKEHYYFIYPTKPHEYERTYKDSYQHGGISLEELILPVGILTPKKVS
jgi:CheY-like chemotaxis protein